MTSNLPIVPVPAFIQQDLYFGLNLPGGGQVSDTEFQAFLDNVIAPRFQGLTQFDVKGQVKDTSGSINKEQSRLVTLITEDTIANRFAINEVRATYGQEFEGKGSLQVTNADNLKVNFGPATDLFNNSCYINHRHPWTSSHYLTFQRVETAPLPSTS